MYGEKEKYILLMFQKITQILKKKVTLLMIPKGEGWHYFALKKLSVLLRVISCKHNGGFFSLNCLHSFAAANKRESHKERIFGF